MSIYRDLNELQLDLDEYEELNLTDYEKTRWKKRVIKKLNKGKHRYWKKYVGIAAAIILALGIANRTGIVSVANMPFVAGLIENYISDTEQLDYAAYKTEIGETAENEFGKMTLNEVLIDGGRLLISSTFEPAEGVDFHYQMHPIPKVLINGQDLSLTTGGQTVEINDTMFTIYSEVDIKEIPLGDRIQFHIEYNRIDLEMPIESPWVFDINIPTEQVAAASQTVQFNQKIQIGNGQSILLEKMIVTPISTVLYYDWPEEADHIAFKIVSESGTEIRPNSAAITPEESYNRYPSIDLQTGKYYLVPYKQSANPHAVGSSEISEQLIPINP